MTGQHLARVEIRVEPHYDPTLTAVRVHIETSDKRFGYSDLIVTDHFESVFDRVLERAVHLIKRQVKREVSNAGTPE